MAWPQCLYLKSFDLINGIERKIDEPVLFPVICHGCSNAEFRLDFLLIDRQTLNVEIDRCFYLPRDDSVSIIDEQQIPIQQRTLTETGHAGKQTYIQNKQLKGLQILIGF